MNEYSELVIELHNIARAVELRLGECPISESIRQCANTLHELGEPLKVKE